MIFLYTIFLRVLVALWSHINAIACLFMQGEGKLQESKLQLRRSSYPFTSYRPKWKFLPCFNHTLQFLKGNPHNFFIPRDWLVRQAPYSLWRLCNKLLEDLRMDMLFRVSFLELQNNEWPSASKLQLQGIITFNSKVIIKTLYAKIFHIYHWWPTKSLMEIGQSCILEYPILQGYM